MYEAKLTWRELRRRYPDRWVMLVELDWVDNELRAGVAIGDGRTRTAAIAYGAPLLDLCRERSVSGARSTPEGACGSIERGFAVFYTGPEEAPARRFPAPARPAVFDVTAPMFAPRVAG